MWCVWYCKDWLNIWESGCRVTMAESRCRECKFWIIEGSVAVDLGFILLALFRCSNWIPSWWSCNGLLQCIENWGEKRNCCSGLEYIERDYSRDTFKPISRGLKSSFMCKKSLPTDSCQVNWLTLDLKPSAQQTRCKMFLTQGAEWPSRIHMFGLFIFWTESLMNKDRDCGRPQLACAIATSLLQGTVRWAWGLLQGITLKVNFIYDLQKKWGRFWTRVWRIYSNIRIFEYLAPNIRYSNTNT